MHRDENKHLKLLAKGAVCELGDRMLQIVDNTSKQVYKQFYICSSIIQEVVSLVAGAIFGV